MHDGKGALLAFTDNVPLHGCRISISKASPWKSCLKWCARQRLSKRGGEASTVSFQCRRILAAIWTSLMRRASTPPLCADTLTRRPMAGPAQAKVLGGSCPLVLAR